MNVFKCKMCGGNLIIREDASVCECESCGSFQTVPILDSEKKKNLFTRANRLRFDSEFDKAALIYASITAEFPDEAEAYWGMCLCKYGIEYVDDPVTGEKIPTCHRTLTSSILDDTDYLQTKKNADPLSRPLYETEARKIDEIQQDILRIVKSESPYDVFISYKETDENGNRTEESVYAYEIYDSLTNKGLKVFFARISLEDKLGQQYEPYIFAALQSATVMIVVGTSFENFDAVWVKNEWSRFLELMKTDRTKKLIPCFSGIDADEMPKAFQRFQAQDLSKLGWIQDLTHGVVKICGKKENIVNEPPINYGRNRNYDYLDRAMVYLEDGMWEKAAYYAGQEAYNDPQSSKAYQIKLLAEMKVRTLDDLRKKDVLISRNINFIRALQNAEGTDREKLKKIDIELTEKERYKCVEKINRLTDKMVKATTMQEFKQIEDEIKTLYEFPEVVDFKLLFQRSKEHYIENSYRRILQAMSSAEYEEALSIIEQIEGYKDTLTLKDNCNKEIEKIETYNKALDLKQRSYYDAAAKTFKNLGGFRDSPKQARICSRKVKVKLSVFHKMAVVIHAILAIFLSLVIGTYTENYMLKQANTPFMIIGLISAFVVPVLITKFDKRKKTVRVCIDILLCFVFFCVIAINAQDWQPLSAAIGTGAFIILTIFL